MSGNPELWRTRHLACVASTALYAQRRTRVLHLDDVLTGNGRRDTRLWPHVLLVHISVSHHPTENTYRYSVSVHIEAGIPLSK